MVIRFYDSAKRTVFHCKSATFLPYLFPMKGNRPAKKGKGKNKGARTCGNPLCEGGEEHHPSCLWNEHEGKDESDDEASELETESEEEEEIQDEERTTRPRAQRQLFDPALWQAQYDIDLANTAVATETKRTLQLLRNKRRGRGHAFARKLPAGSIPASREEAIFSEERDEWVKAMREEWQAHKLAKTMQRIKRSKIPKGRRTIKARWAFDIKKNADGSVARYKARLVAKGYMQRLGLDYGETYAPTPALASVRTILSMAVQMGFDVKHMDVKTAFLIPPLPEDEAVFMESPPGVRAEEEEVYKLLKCIYGLKQSANKWHEELHKTLHARNFTPLDADACVYTHRSKKTGEIDCIIAVHVDDILIAGRQGMIKNVSQGLRDTYTMKDLGQLSWYLGIAVTWRVQQGPS